MLSPLLATAEPSSDCAPPRRAVPSWRRGWWLPLLSVSGIVYHELLCCTRFHCCHLCSEPFVLASIVVVVAARFSRSSLVRYRGAVVATVTNDGPRGK
ncbi:uncharacterized protein DS421_6g194710 [Arachis hypogaea]|nr:uncharacterized protein DS421_6g194710 [Arachis hypogaea]